MNIFVKTHTIADPRAEEDIREPHGPVDIGYDEKNERGLTSTPPFYRHPISEPFTGYVLIISQYTKVSNCDLTFSASVVYMTFKPFISR